MLSPQQVDEIKAYKQLPEKDQVMIIRQISELVLTEANGDTISSETISKCLTATGHLEIALACYAAQLYREPWR